MAANGYLPDFQTATGTPFRLVAAPVQVNENRQCRNGLPSSTKMAIASWPDIGLDIDAILDLKIRGVVA